MLKIYGPKASSTSRCLWLAEEVGAEYENIPVDMPGKQHKTDEFLAINPNGKVPALVDGDFKLFESMAINNYIAEKYQPELLGSTLEEHALISQWSYWAIADLSPNYQPLYAQWFRKTPDDEKTVEARAKILTTLKVLNAALADKTNLVGERFTLADVNCGSTVAVTRMFGMDLSSLSNVDAWVTALSQRPAFQKVRPEMSK